MEVGVMLVSESGNTSKDLNTGELEMKDAEQNKEFPYVWEGKGEK